MRLFCFSNLLPTTPVVMGKKHAYAKLFFSPVFLSGSFKSFFLMGAGIPPSHSISSGGHVKMVVVVGGCMEVGGGVDRRMTAVKVRKHICLSFFKEVVAKFRVYLFQE